MDSIKNQILQMIPDQKQYLMGFADMGNLISHPYQYAISIARRLDDDIIDRIQEGPNSVYRNHYHAINEELNEVAISISGFLKSKQIDCQPVTATVTETELQGEFQNTLRYHLSHKMVATRAGLGWIGKTDLLITKQFGPRVRLASVLTNYKFEQPGIPIEASQCKSCKLCVEACPGQVATGQLWNVQIDRDQFYTASKCKETCKALSLKNGINDITICGICVSVCPMGSAQRRK